MVMGVSVKGVAALTVFIRRGSAAEEADNGTAAAVGRSVDCAHHTAFLGHVLWVCEWVV